jgi:hypothetical protein
MAVKGSVKKDLVGKRFGKLVVLDDYKTDKNRKTYWLCQCDCGNKKYIYRQNLIKGKVKSCGCIVRTINNLSKTRIYKIWCKMKERCYNSNHHEYYNYGGKGIAICDEWHDFMNFYDWAINNGYEDSLTIDRINSNLGYSPSNCRWATKSQNTASANKGSHRRKTKFMYYGISPNGDYFEFSNASQFAREHGLNGALIRDVANGRKKTHKGWKFGFTDKPNI